MTTYIIGRLLPEGILSGILELKWFSSVCSTMRHPMKIWAWSRSATLPGSQDATQNRTLVDDERS